MDKFLLVLFSILLCVLAMVYFKNICHTALLLTTYLCQLSAYQTSERQLSTYQLSTQQLETQQLVYGGACHDKHKYVECIVVDGLNIYNCLRDFLTAQGINKNPLKTTNPHILYFALIRSMLIATKSTIHLVAKDDTVVYDVMMNILYKKSSLANAYPRLQIPEHLLHRIKFYYATYTSEGRGILQKAKSELEIAKKDIMFVDPAYKNDYIAADEILKKKKHPRYTDEQKKCFNDQLIAINKRKDKIYSLNLKPKVNAALDTYIDMYEKEHALRGIDDNLALFTLSNVFRENPSVYYVSNDMLSEMPRKLRPSNYMYKVFTNDVRTISYTNMDVEKNLSQVTNIVENTKLLSKCMFTIDEKNNDICFILYKPSGKDGKTIVHIAGDPVQPALSSDVLEVYEELTALYILLQLYLKTKSDSDREIILQHIDTDALCAEYGQKMTSYKSMQELIIESKENLISVSEIKKLLNADIAATNPYTNQGISYLLAGVTFDIKILLAIKYLLNTNDLQSYTSANYISRIKYISNKPVGLSSSLIGPSVLTASPIIPALTID